MDYWERVELHRRRGVSEAVARGAARGVGGSLQPRDRLGRWRDVPGVRFVSTLGNEARNLRATKGYIAVGPKFLELEPSEQDSVIAHEMGHDVADELLRDPNGWWWDEDEWRDAEGYILNGPGAVPAERISDAYAALVRDTGDAERWPAIERLRGEIQRRGLPLAVGPAS